MSTSELEPRIIELEARLAFQDETIAQLNNVVVVQQDQIDRLERQFDALRSRFANLNAGVEAGVGEEGTADPYERERPPHY